MKYVSPLPFLTEHVDFVLPDGSSLTIVPDNEVQPGTVNYLADGAHVHPSDIDSPELAQQLRAWAESELRDK